MRSRTVTIEEARKPLHLDNGLDRWPRSAKGEHSQRRQAHRELRERTKVSYSFSRSCMFYKRRRDEGHADAYRCRVSHLQPIITWTVIACRPEEQDTSIE